MDKKLKLAIIGYGQRGRGLAWSLLKMKDVEIVAGCDLYEDRASDISDYVESVTGKKIYTTTNYKDIIKNCNPDAVIVSTSWSSHTEISMFFMEEGIPVGCEVAGAQNLQEVWNLVNCYRKTGTEYMMLENACYDRREMMLLNMIKMGIFGEIVHCDGGYRHYLCDEILGGKENRHYRLNNYIHRNCDNYPTHPIGPIAKFLNINHGNRFLSLTSTASKQAGLQAYIKRYGVKNKELVGKKFNQGDMITTTIKCSNGETITLKLCTTLPGHYSMNMNVFGTDAFYHEETKSVIVLDDGVDIEKTRWREFWGNQEEYDKKYGHPLWKAFEKENIKDVHGGCDYLTLRAFIEAVKNNEKMPIDVYDAAAWMAITPLSEMSIANGSAPVSFPDFTYGQWIEPYTPSDSIYSLDKISDASTVDFFRNDKLKD